jgi:hypothetical protein
MPHFGDSLRAFLDAHQDLFSDEERDLMTHKELLPLGESLGAREYSQLNRELLPALLNLYAAKLDQKQAEANERHAKAMTWLTIALIAAAGVEAVGTVVAALIGIVSVLVELGVIG